MKRILMSFIVLSLLVAGCRAGVTGKAVAEDIINSGAVDLDDGRYQHLDLQDGKADRIPFSGSDIRIDRKGSTRVYIAAKRTVKLGYLAKNINSADVYDCNIPIAESYVELISGGTVCIKDEDNKISMIGGTFYSNMGVPLIWRSYSKVGCTPHYYRECSESYPSRSYRKALTENCEEITIQVSSCGKGCDETTGACRHQYSYFPNDR